MGRCAFGQIAASLATALSMALAASSSASDLQYGKYLASTDVDKGLMVERYVVADESGFHLVAVSKYEVRTTLGPEFTLRMAFLMDDFHAKFSAVFKGRFALFDKPKLYVLNDQAAYQAFVRAREGTPSWSIGMFMRRGRDSILASYKMDDDKLERVLFHEGAHQLLYAYIGEQEIPTWFNEGVATNLETWDLAYTAPENVKRSIVDSHRRHVAVEAIREGQAVPIGHLMALSPMEWSMVEDPQVNYAMAWSLVNYLLSTTTGRSTFNKILIAIKKGGAPRQLLSRGALETLEIQWHKDVQTRMVLYDEHVAPALRLVQKKDIDGARALAEAGVAAYPTFADARYCRGLVYRAAGRYAEAVSDLLEALRADTSFPRIYTELGRCYEGMGDRTQALNYLRKAARRNPYNRDASRLIEDLNGR
jgi:hypothetical protein